MGKKAQLKRLKKEQSLSGQTLPSSQPSGFKLSKQIKQLSLSVLFIAVLSIGIGVRLNHLDFSRRSPDEGIYTYQANEIAGHGIDGTRKLIREYINDKSMWVCPPPTRIGYDYLLAAIMKISAVHDEMAGTYISVVASIGTLLVLVLMGLRFFNPQITLIALFGMCLSPMDLAIARRCWQDSLLAFCGTLYIYLCGELIKNSKRKILYVPLLLIGGYCMLIKESGVVIFGLGMLWLLYEAVFKERSIFSAILTIAAGIICAAGSVFILVKVTGGISDILTILKHIKEAMPTNTYAVEYQTGPWYRMIEGFWILSPIFTILAFLGCIVTFLYGRFKALFFSEDVMNTRVIRGIAFFVLSFIVITIITPYCQNMRYVSVIFAPFYLLGGLGLWFIICLFRQNFNNFYFNITAGVIGIALIIFAIRDYRLFKYMFLEREIVDLSIRLLREMLQG